MPRQTESGLQAAKYERRVVAYIDLLGFKDLVGLTITRAGKDSRPGIALLQKIYKTFRKPWQTDGRGRFETIKSKRVTFFSDCVVVSFVIKDRAGVFDTIYNVRRMQMDLLRLGVVCRGAITIGKVIHTSSLIFGPGLVEAYLQEVGRAIYPRIIVADAVANLAQASPLWTMDPEGFKIPKQIVLRDIDGCQYVDYFRIYAEDCRFPDLETYYYLRDSRKTIVNGLTLAKVQRCPRLEAKFAWMQTKFDEALGYHNNEKYLEFLWAIEDAERVFIQKLRRMRPIEQLDTASPDNEQPSE